VKGHRQFPWRIVPFHHPLRAVAAASTGPSSRRGPDADRRSRIVFITHDLSQSETEASLREYLARDARRATSPSGCRRWPNTGGRWLNEAEQARLFAALADEDDRSAANVLRLMLLTGVACDDVRTAPLAGFRPRWPAGG
jgi:hypothetical protein